MAGLFGRNRKTPMGVDKTESALSKDFGFGLRLNRSVSLDYQALTNSAYWSCITLLCQNYATLPLYAYAKGNRKALGEERFLAQLLARPNKYMNHYDFMYVMALNYENAGIAVAILERNRDGYVISMLPVSPGTMVAHWKGDEILYRCATNGKDYKMSDLLIINNTPIGYGEVLSPMTYASDDIELANKCKELQREYYSGGSVIGNVISIPDRYYDDKRNTIKEQFNSNRGFRNVVVPESVKVEPIKVGGEDISKLIDAQSWDINEVARRFHVPPFMLGDTRATMGNTEQQMLQFVTQCIQPRCKAWEIAFNQSICPAGTYVKFELRGLMRGDHSTRAAFYHNGLMDGWLTCNQVRELEDMDPYEGGDVYHFALNYGTVRKDGSIDNPNIAASPTPSEGCRPDDDEKKRKCDEPAEAPVQDSDEEPEKGSGYVKSSLATKTIDEALAEMETDDEFKANYRRAYESRSDVNAPIGTHEAFRLYNSTIVHNAQGKTLLANGLPTMEDGKWSINGKVYRNPPFFDGDETIVTVKED